MAEKYTTKQFIDAMPGTGGVISAIAQKISDECSWNTAKAYIEKYPTVKTAWENERQKITDKARHNIIKSIHDGDLQMSKWWLQVMDAEFVPVQRNEHTGAYGGALTFTVRFEDDECA